MQAKQTFELVFHSGNTVPIIEGAWNGKANACQVGFVQMGECGIYGVCPVLKNLDSRRFMTISGSYKGFFQQNTFLDFDGCAGDVAPANVYADGYWVLQGWDNSGCEIYRPKVTLINAQNLLQLTTFCTVFKRNTNSDWVKSDWV